MAKQRKGMSLQSPFSRWRGPWVRAAQAGDPDPINIPWKLPGKEPPGLSPRTPCPARVRPGAWQRLPQPWGQDPPRWPCR